MINIKIIYDDQSYSVIYTGTRGNTSDIGYGDKDTSPEDHANNIYEALIASGSCKECTIELVEV